MRDVPIVYWILLVLLGIMIAIYILGMLHTFDLIPGLDWLDGKR